MAGSLPADPFASAAANGAAAAAADAAQRPDDARAQRRAARDAAVARAAAAEEEAAAAAAARDRDTAVARIRESLALAAAARKEADPVSDNDEAPDDAAAADATFLLPLLLISWLVPALPPLDLSLGLLRSTTPFLALTEPDDDDEDAGG